MQLFIEQLFSLLLVDLRFVCLQNMKDSQMKRLLQGEKVSGRYHPNVLKKLLAKYPECHNIKGLHIQRNLLNSLDESKRKPVPFDDTGRPFNKKTV